MFYSNEEVEREEWDVLGGQASEMDVGYDDTTQHYGFIEIPINILHSYNVYRLVRFILWALNVSLKNYTYQNCKDPTRKMR